MTRKDYEMIARAIRDAWDEIREGEKSAKYTAGSGECFLHLITKLEEEFTADNPRFQARRFSLAAWNSETAYMLAEEYEKADK